MNVVVLQGSLPRGLESRDLPSGDVVVSFDVTTRDAQDAADTVPVAWTNPPASIWSFAEGDDVVVVGHVRRRFFRSGGLTQSRTEVVAEQMTKVRQGKRSRIAIEHAVDRILGVGC